MRRNNGKQTKEITIVVPESVEIIDIKYYWKSSGGISLTTAAVLVDENCMDGAIVDIYKFPEEEDGET